MTAFRSALLVLAAPVIVWAVVVLCTDEPPAAPAARGVVATPMDLPAAQVLRHWDARRAAAYAAGSSRLLADLYVDGSRAGASDVRLLRAYRARGWRVTGMRMQVLAIRVLERRSEHLRVEVTDRLEHAVAVRDGQRVVLPRDRSSTRRISFERGADAEWRVAAVAPLS